MLDKFIKGKAKAQENQVIDNANPQGNRSSLSSMFKSLSVGSGSNPQFKLNDKDRIIELPNLELFRETLETFSKMPDISENLSQEILSKCSDTYKKKNDKFQTLQMPLEHRLAYGQIEYKRSHLYYNQENEFAVDHQRFDNSIKHLYRAASALHPRAIREILYLLPCDPDNFEYIQSHFTALNTLTAERNFHSSWGLVTSLNYTENILMSHLNQITSTEGILKAYQDYLNNPGNIIFSTHIEDCVDVLINKYESWNKENITDFIRPHQRNLYSENAQRYTHESNIYKGSQTDVHEQIIQTYKKLIENHDTHFSNKLLECLEPNRNFMLNIAHIVERSYIPQEHIKTIWDKSYPLIRENNSLKELEESGIKRVMQVIPKMENIKFSLKALLKDSTIDSGIREFLQDII